jgi:hypothetical protein
VIVDLLDADGCRGVDEAGILVRWLDILTATL